MRSRATRSFVQPAAVNVDAVSSHALFGKRRGHPRTRKRSRSGVNRCQFSPPPPAISCHPSPSLPSLHCGILVLPPPPLSVRPPLSSLQPQKMPSGGGRESPPPSPSRASSFVLSIFLSHSLLPQCERTSALTQHSLLLCQQCDQREGGGGRGVPLRFAENRFLFPPHSPTSRPLISNESSGLELS